MKKLIIPNIDTWLQAQTQQRYSYRTLKDMMSAFSSGLQHSYVNNDLNELCGRVFDESVKVIFNSEFTRSYATAYKIELMEPKQVSKLINQIKDNFDEYVKKFGVKRFHLYLCRLLKFCSYNEQNETTVVETLINRLGIDSTESEFIEPKDSDKVRNRVINNIIGSGVAKFKDIELDVLKNVDDIQAGVII